MKNIISYHRYPELLPSHSPALHRQLLSAIDATLEDTRQNYSIFLSYPGLEEPGLLYEPRVMRSASMIKVFLLAMAMERVQAGTLSLTQEIVLTDADRLQVKDSAGSIERMPVGTRLTMGRVLELMIIESDNSATNIIIDLLGMEEINTWLQSRDYQDTMLARRMMDLAAVAEGKENLTSARDLGLFFTRLYEAVRAGDVQAKWQEKILLRQTDVSVLGRALPHCLIAHKTGQLESLYHDGGIIYSPAGPIILVLLSDCLPDEAGNKVNLQELAVNIELTLRLQQAGALVD